jgi:hypothetical protein
MPKLKVRQIPDEDVYKDIIRVPEAYRIDENGNTIEESRACRIGGAPRGSVAVLRGWRGSMSAEIHMDEKTRNRLGVRLDECYDFTFRPVGLWGQLVWAWNASETGYRVASRLAVIGLMLGVLAFIPVLWDWAKLIWQCTRGLSK